MGELVLLVRNLQPQDQSLLNSLLIVPDDVEMHHRLLTGLLDVAGAHPQRGMKDVLMFVFETSPCLLVGVTRWNG